MAISGAPSSPLSRQEHLHASAVAIDGNTIVAVGPAADIATRFRGTEQINTVGQVVFRPHSMPTPTRQWCCTAGSPKTCLYRNGWRIYFPAEAKTVSREMVRVGTLALRLSK